MKTSLLLSTFLIISTLSSISQTKNFIDQPYIETTACVDTMVTPDRIYMGIIITEKDTKGKVSNEELEVKMEAALKSIGINTAEKLTLFDLASNFKKYFIKPKEVLKSKSYRLLVEDAVLAGKVIIELEKVDISNVRIERVEYSEIESLRLKLKTKAILKAKQQTEFMAKPLGQKVGAAIYISDITKVISENVYDERGEDAFRISTIKFKKELLPEIQFDKIKVQSAIKAKFKLE